MRKSDRIKAADAAAPYDKQSAKEHKALWSGKSQGDRPAKTEEGKPGQ